MPAPDDDQLFSLLIHIAQRCAEYLLGERGEVAPFSVRLVGDDVAPLTSFPQDANGDAEWPALLDTAIDALRLDEPHGDVHAVAVCTGLASPDTDGKAFGVQLETPQSVAFVLVPYRSQDGSWQLDDPSILDTLLRPEGLRWDRSTGRRLARA